MHTRRARGHKRSSKATCDTDRRADIKAVTSHVFAADTSRFGSCQTPCIELDRETFDTVDLLHHAAILNSVTCKHRLSCRCNNFQWQRSPRETVDCTSLILDCSCMHVHSSNRLSPLHSCNSTTNTTSTYVSTLSKRPTDIRPPSPTFLSRQSLRHTASYLYTPIHPVVP